MLQYRAILFSIQSNSYATTPREDKEKLAAQGFTQVVVFDTFAEPKDLEVLHTELQKNPDSHLFLNLKEGDRRYNQKLSPAVTSTITAIPRDISFLGLSASRLNLDLTEGGTLLDNGLSRTPSSDGEAIKEYWYTKGSTEEVFVVYRSGLSFPVMPA